MSVDHLALLYSANSEAFSYASGVFGFFTAAGTVYAASQVSSYWRTDESTSYLKSLTGNAWLAILWSLIGFSVAYGPSQASRVIGGAQLATIDAFNAHQYLSIAFVYTVGLALMANAIVGSVSSRMSWGNYIVFATLWTLGAYVPLTHWFYAASSDSAALTPDALTKVAAKLAETFGLNAADAATRAANLAATNIAEAKALYNNDNAYNGGWLGTQSATSYGVADFAAVHAIHINAGVSALVLTYWMRHHDSVEHAHNVWDILPALLFGWINYVCGASSNYTSGANIHGNAGAALVNTVLAGAGGAFTWAAVEWIVADAHLEVAGGWRKLFTGAPTATGAVTGLVSGLVSISAAGGFVSPMWAIFFGFFTALVVFFGPTIVSRYLPNFAWAAKQNYSAFMVHGVAGAVGSALTGLFANSSFQAGGYKTGEPSTWVGASGGAFNGSFYFNSAQLGKQCAGITITILVAIVSTTVAYWATFYVGRLCFYPTQTGLSDLETGDEKL